MKTPAAVSEAAPADPFSFPAGAHPGNLLLRLTGKMESRLTQAITDFWQMMPAGNQDSRLSSALLTHTGTSFT